MPDGPPATGVAATCDSAGVLAPIVDLIAAVQCAEALKILVGDFAAVSRKLAVFDLWRNEFRAMSLESLAEQGGCPACDLGRRDWLNSDRFQQSEILCGRNSVQLKPGESSGAEPVLDLDLMAGRLQQFGSVRHNAYLLKFNLEEAHRAYELTLFADGRTIIMGTDDPVVARSIYARYIGN